MNNSIKKMFNILPQIFIILGLIILTVVLVLEETNISFLESVGFLGLICVISGFFLQNVKKSSEEAEYKKRLDDLYVAVNKQAINDRELALIKNEGIKAIYENPRKALKEYEGIIERANSFIYIKSVNLDFLYFRNDLQNEILNAKQKGIQIRFLLLNKKFYVRYFGQNTEKIISPKLTNFFLSGVMESNIEVRYFSEIPTISFILSEKEYIYSTNLFIETEYSYPYIHGYSGNNYSFNVLNKQFMILWRNSKECNN